MTTKSLRYEKFECDICKKVEKKEIEQQDNGDYLFEGANYMISITWSTITLDNARPTKKPDPVKIEMCEECDLSFKSWRLKREHQ